MAEVNGAAVDVHASDVDRKTLRSADDGGLLTDAAPTKPALIRCAEHPLSTGARKEPHEPASSHPVPLRFAARKCSEEVTGDPANNRLRDLFMRMLLADDDNLLSTLLDMRPTEAEHRHRDKFQASRLAGRRV